MDLFAQLAQQSLGMAPAPVLPRLAARYEPLAAGPALGAEAAEQRADALAPQPIAALAERASVAAQASVATIADAPLGRAAHGPQPQRMVAPSGAAKVGEREAVLPRADLAAPREQRAILEQPTIEPLPARSLASGAHQPGVQPARTPVMPALPTPPEAARVAADIPAAPVIRVSIGRVEVRAIVRPQEPPRREREAPHPAGQPLDAYLRKGKREP